MIRLTLVPIALCALSSACFATKLIDCRPVDDQYLMLTWVDSEVHYQDDGKGPSAFGTREQGKDTLETFGLPLDTTAATTASSFALQSTDDPHYRSPKSPVSCSRRTKVDGTAWAWPDPQCGIRHTIFLKLPTRLAQGKHYSLTIGGATHSDVPMRNLVFDVTRNESEAVHVNLIGYMPTDAESADLYMWMGDGGARDYTTYAGRQVSVLNVKSGSRVNVGRVSYWKPSGPDVGTWNLTASPVWNCDFSSFRNPGTYRLVVEGVGCSPQFEIRKEIYFEPLKTSVRGFYYMRLGEAMNANSPPPRQPRLIPGKAPAGLRVIRTTYGPWHPDWATAGGDQWDNRDWSKYAEPGNPTNPEAWGGHSDAADWDRNCAHISIIWDLLLPIILTNGAPANDDLGIPESGNGVPDLIDEARNEVDFWLRLRDGQGGYSAGLNNPSQDNTLLYQAGASPYMAWASAANAAMLADAYRICGKRALMARYRDAAIEAWNKAGNEGLDLHYGIGNGTMRGRDLKMMAAASLYNVTGDQKYEDAMAETSVIVSGSTPTDQPDKFNQLWGTASYLMCDKFKWQPIHRSQLLGNMRSSVMAEAQAKNIDKTGQRPSRRASDDAYGWFQTSEEVQRVCVAHAIATSPTDRAEARRALLLEADWGLGRNPMNMVQMTGLGSRRPAYVYISGGNDGVPECHPGITPYCNAEPWGSGFMADPQYYARKGYPDWKQWPIGEALWNAPYCYSNNEFTPQQTMRGKNCLYAYLYATR